MSRKLEGRVVVYTTRHQEVRPILERAWPDLPVDYGFGHDFFAKAIGEAEIFYTYRFPHELLGRVKCLRWIQGTGAGADQFMPFEDLPSGILVTNAAGINEDMMADFTIALVLALQLNLKRYIDQQRARQWKRVQAEELIGKTLAVIGLGRIGKGVARRARAMGMRVIGTSRLGAPVADADAVFPAEHLHAVLEQADFVALTVPLTPATVHVIDQKALEAMRPAAYLINVSRGRVVDEKALVEALRSGRIAGAALDVFEEEPLPADSPLWGFENVILTPHVGGDLKGFTDRSARLFCENIGRYLDGEALINQVDLVRGY